MSREFRGALERERGKIRICSAPQKTGATALVAAITAGCAVPFVASPEKFPAVPVGSINLQTDAISKRGL
jgi:hypothetical protein